VAAVSPIVPTHPGTTDPLDLKRWMWVRVGRATSEALVNDADVPLWLRVFHAAMLRLDRYGLAHFERGELARMVAPIDPATGEVALVHHVGSKGVDRCIAKGLFTADSTARRIGVMVETASVGGFSHKRIA
jgi:hypothetical protein